MDGARIAFEDLRPALEGSDPELAEELQTRFSELRKNWTSTARATVLCSTQALDSSPFHPVPAAVNTWGSSCSNPDSGQMKDNHRARLRRHALADVGHVSTEVRFMVSFVLARSIPRRSGPGQREGPGLAAAGVAGPHQRCDTGD